MTGRIPRILTLDMAGPAGLLEGVLRLPTGEPRRAALLCHPDPLHQGSMHSPVIFRCARALHRREVATLRFNFRGVGRSAGVHDEGRGEKEDVRAALETLCERVPHVPVALAGYSFGCRVGFEAVVEDARVDWLIGIGIPVALSSFGFLKGIEKRVLLVQGERDEYGPLPAVERLVRQLGSRSSLEIVPGADHLFQGELGKLEEILYAALGE